MESNQNAEASTSTTASPVKANWAALSSETLVTEIPAQQNQETIKQTPDVKAATESTQAASTSEEAKLPDIKDETSAVDKPASETPANESKNTELTLDPSLIKDAPKTFEPNTAQALAQELGLTLEKESFEDFQKALKENFVPKADLEKAKEITKEDILSTFKPEVAAALKLKELGIPEEYVFNPTGRHDQLLSLEDAELVRAVYENSEGWDADMIDTQMEELAATGKMAHQAKIARLNINKERQDIINTQSQLVQQYTQKQQEAVTQQKVQSDAKFFEHLSKADKFLGLPIPKESKEAIVAKYKQGKYDNVLSDPNNKMLAIMYLEYGDHLAKQLATRSKAEGQAEIIRNLSDVPNKKALGGGRAVDTSQDKPNNWSALKG